MGVAEDVEVLFPVGVAVAGVVGADGFAFEGVAGGLVEAGGESVGEGVAFGGVAGPAGGGVPAGAVAGGVDVEGCEDLVGEVAGVGVFEEDAVWGAFAGGVVAVGGV